MQRPVQYRSHQPRLGAERTIVVKKVNSHGLAFTGFKRISFSSEREHFDHFWSMTRQHSQKIVLLPIASKFGPQEVNRFSQLCAKFQALGSFELHATIFSNLVKMALPSGRILSRLLRRMKAFIDEFRPNTSQANYFRGFWRITSEINAKIEVIKQ